MARGIRKGVSQQGLLRSPMRQTSAHWPKHLPLCGQKPQKRVAFFFCALKNKSPWPKINWQTVVWKGLWNKTAYLPASTMCSLMPCTVRPEISSGAKNPGPIWVSNFLCPVNCESPSCTQLSNIWVQESLNLVGLRPLEAIDSGFNSISVLLLPFVLFGWILTVVPSKDFDTENEKDGMWDNNQNVGFLPV